MRRRELDRALRGRTVDLIRDGVPRAELRAKGDRAVWTALVRTAGSASQRGWDCWEWEAELAKPTSQLGAQARVRSSRQKPRTAKQTSELLQGAWDKATEWASAQDAPEDADGIAARARDWAAELLIMVADPAAELLDTDRAVLAYAAAQAIERGMDRVALPRRAVMTATGYGERTVRTVLERLHGRGLLVRESPGRSGVPGVVGPAEAKAALFLLPDPVCAAALLYRGTRSMGPPAQVYGTPAQSEPYGTPAQVYGTPRPSSVPSTSAAHQETPPVVTLTLTADTPERLAAALDLLHRQPGTQVAPSVAPAGVPPQEAHSAAPDNVRPLRRAGRVS